MPPQSQRATNGMILIHVKIGHPMDVVASLLVKARVVLCYSFFIVTVWLGYYHTVSTGMYQLSSYVWWVRTIL